MPGGRAPSIMEKTMKNILKIVAQVLAMAMACGGGYIVFLVGRELYAAIDGSSFVFLDTEHLIHLGLLVIGVAPVLIAYRLLGDYGEHSLQDFCALCALLACAAIMHHADQVSAWVRLGRLNGFENHAVFWGVALIGPYVLYSLLFRMLKKYSM